MVLLPTLAGSLPGISMTPGRELQPTAQEPQVLFGRPSHHIGGRFKTV